MVKICRGYHDEGICSFVWGDKKGVGGRDEQKKNNQMDINSKLIV